MEMNDRDKTYLLKELTRTIEESDSTAAFCLCQRWILKDALSMLKDRPEIVRCKDCKYATMTSDGKVCKYCEMEIDDSGDQRYVCYDEDWYCANGERRE